MTYAIDRVVTIVVVEIIFKIMLVPAFWPNSIATGMRIL